MIAPADPQYGFVFVYKPEDPHAVVEDLARLEAEGFDPIGAVGNFVYGRRKTSLDASRSADTPSASPTSVDPGDTDPLKSVEQIVRDVLATVEHHDLGQLPVWQRGGETLRDALQFLREDVWKVQAKKTAGSAQLPKTITVERATGLARACHDLDSHARDDAGRAAFHYGIDLVIKALAEDEP